jgi:hypothetical protein
VNEQRDSGDEVKSYVRRLLLVIFLGVVLMASAATWAFLTYGKKLERAAPLPAGAPPMQGDTSESR